MPSLRLTAKALVKEAVGALTRHRPADLPNICLYATRRGGSTWLMELIAANPGITYSDQPFSIYSASARQRNRIPTGPSGKLITVDDEAWARVSAYLEDLFSGRLRVNGPWRVWDPQFDWVSSRVVLKIVDAKALIDRIDQHFAVKTVYSTRHPIPTALSIIRNGWGLTTQAFLENPDFVHDHLSDRQQAYVHDVMEGDSLLLKHVVNWILENLVPLRLLPERPHWLHVRYEDLVIEPESTVRSLATHLGLPCAEPMLARLTLPSRSTKQSSTARTRARIAAGDSAWVHSRWRERISQADHLAVRDALARFDINLYADD
ncbi:MAG: sulfotransferase [Pseudomonadota bacterium]